MTNNQRLFDGDLDEFGGPAALIATTAVTRCVVDLRADPVFTGLAEVPVGFRLEEQLPVALVEETHFVVVVRHVARAAVLVPADPDVGLRTVAAASGCAATAGAAAAATGSD